MGVPSFGAMRLLAIALAALALAACSSDDDDTGSGPSPYLPGGVDAFEAYVAKQGKPVVVNKWASWCGPCRFEFPFFQQVAAERGKEIAFLGVQSADSTAAGETFLEEFPLPYPSYSDPDDEIAELFKGFSWPSTAFYDARGELVYTRQGPYASAQDLEREIDRYVG